MTSTHSYGVTCVQCSQPVPFGTGHGLKYTYCRKCYEKKAKQEHGGDFAAALFAIWEENLTR